MPKINIREEKVSGGNTIVFKDGSINLVIRLHFYDKKLYEGSIRISMGDDGIILNGDSNTINKIKTLLTKRDNLAEIAWSVLQNEYRTLEKLEDKVERLQNASISEYSQNLLRNVLYIKKNLFYTHRDYIRIRNIVENAIDEGYYTEEMQKILRDINEMIDIVEYLIEASTTAIQLMQNTLTAKMNEIMKILTVIATIMMPLGLIASIYGMNFRQMPELYWRYGYYYALSLMIIISIIMLAYLKIKKII